MSKITVQIPVSPESIEREITLPCYRKNEYASFYKVISEDEMIVVLSSGAYLIGVRSMDAEIFDRSHSPCTPQEFDQAYEAVMEKLTQLKGETV